MFLFFEKTACFEKFVFYFFRKLWYNEQKYSGGEQNVIEYCSS